jgi:hypothetical protein
MAQDAQTFPGNPIRFIVPVPSGGGVDALARIVGEILRNMWGAAGVDRNPRWRRRQHRRRGGVSGRARRPYAVVFQASSNVPVLVRIISADMRDITLTVKRIEFSQSRLIFFN